MTVQVNVPKFMYIFVQPCFTATFHDMIHYRQMSPVVDILTRFLGMSGCQQNYSVIILPFLE